MENLKLESRDGLPDALRILLEEFPRSDWSGHERFGGLLQFWLERHVMFRRLLDAMQSDAKLMVDGQIEQNIFRAKLSRYGNMFIEQLHGHHTIEDTHYFPMLEKIDPRLSRGFALLDEDHHAIESRLEAFSHSANSILQLQPNMSGHDEAGAFQTVLTDFEKLLNRHLVDEEELIAPVILKYGADNLS